MRKAAWALALALLVAIAADLSRAPRQQLAARAAITGIHVYRATAARVFAASGVTCRFDPTCSHYGEAVIARYGLVRGGWMAGRRIIRCGPWTPMGTLDPPPAGA